MGEISRRRLLVAGASVFLFIRHAAAQQARGSLRLVGLLVPNQLRLQAGYEAFVEELRTRGYRDGQNLRLVLKEAQGRLERLPALVDELVKARVEIIVAFNTPGSRAAIDGTRDIPVVITQTGDPVGSGFVTDLGRPGGNVTGVSNIVAILAPKRMALLKETVPAARRFAVLFNPDDPITRPQVRDVQATAPNLNIEARLFPVREPRELPEAFAEFARWQADCVMWLPGQSHFFRAMSVKLASQYRLPLMVDSSGTIDAGGVLSYGSDNAEIFRRTAAKVVRILQGAKPGDLPVEQPTKLELIVNLKSAKAIGLKIPQSVLLRADRVIE